MRHARSSPPEPATWPAEWSAYEADVVGGLSVVARAELAAVPGLRLHGAEASALEPHVRFTLAERPDALLTLRTVQSVALVGWYDIPRPRALLGDAHLRRLIAQIELVRALHPPRAFQSLALSAAGDDSAIMLRLMTTLADATGLRLAEQDGDLLLRLRRPADGPGWEALVRLTPRPLGTRAWRLCHLPGALNATVAAAMAALARPRPVDVVLNIGCGSGTLLIERLALAAAQRAMGCDNDERALDCARQNAWAAGVGDAITWHAWDARALPLPDGCIDTVLGDLPFGHLVGAHADNVTLYPALLAEAARVARPGARCVLIGHEARLLDESVRSATAWRRVRSLPLVLPTVQATIVVLVRQDRPASPNRPRATGAAAGPPRTRSPKRPRRR